MNDIERWYRRCLLQLDWDLSAGRTEEIKDGLNLFVEDPEWLRYVLQESGWFEHTAMVSVFRKKGNTRILLAVNDPVCLAEALFLDFMECTSGEEVVFDYGKRLSLRACDFLEFLGWNDCAGPVNIAYGLDDFELTWKSIQRGDVVGVGSIADFLVDLTVTDAGEHSSTASRNMGGAISEVRVDANSGSAVGDKHVSRSMEQVESLVRQKLLRKNLNPGHLAVKTYIYTHLTEDPKCKNLALYNKVASAIKLSCEAGNFNGEVKVEPQDDENRPNAIYRYTERGDLEWVFVTTSAFENQVRDVKKAMQCVQQGQ
jgi:hypothetical protein